VLLVADIDRGGAFAHLYGTWSLVDPEERERIAAFVLNKFRGDPALLAPAPEELAWMTGVPVAGVLPMLRHGLPDEDGAAQRSGATGGARVAVVRYPTASNLDEFRAAEQVAEVVFATSTVEVDGADLVVLPGSKHVAADLGWLRATGIAGAVVERARRGGRVLGICGGMQMLGESLRDPEGVEGAAIGLALLPVETTYGREKLTREIAARFEALHGPWSPLSELGFSGYEIRHGRTTATSDAAREAIAGGLGYVSGPVLGVSMHGLLEDPAGMRALLGAAASAPLEAAFDELADAVEEHLDTDLLLRLAGLS
jgi:adenosylcobyric acid synthase